MNTIYYANLKTGKRAAVKIGQHSYGVLIGSHPGRRKDPTTLRPTMAQADEAMARKGFVRWPSKKPIPGFIEIRKAA